MGAQFPRPMRKVKYAMREVSYTVTAVERITPTVAAVRFGLPEEPGVETRGLVGEVARVVVGSGGRKPVTRKYTIRRYDPASREAEIDVTLHEGGLGSDWARSLAPGDTVRLAGIKSGYDVAPDYDFFLLAGDETGWPGIARWLESMPADARGQVYVEVPDLASAQDVAAPEGVQVTWLPGAGPGSTVLADAVRDFVDTTDLEGRSVFVWLAGESGSIRPLRETLRADLGLEKGHMYSSGYWTRKDGRPRAARGSESRGRDGGAERGRPRAERARRDGDGTEAAASEPAGLRGLRELREGRDGGSDRPGHETGAEPEARKPEHIRRREAWLRGEKVAPRRSRR